MVGGRRTGMMSDRGERGDRAERGDGDGDGRPLSTVSIETLLRRRDTLWADVARGPLRVLLTLDGRDARGAVGASIGGGAFGSAGAAASTDSALGTQTRTLSTSGRTWSGTMVWMKKGTSLTVARSGGDPGRTAVISVLPSERQTPNGACAWLCVWGGFPPAPRARREDFTPAALN